jgi:hypothetical protein
LLIPKSRGRPPVECWRGIKPSQAGLDAGAVQGTPDVRALLTAGLQAVVEAATTELPRSGLTGRALRRFDVDAQAGDGAGEPEGSRTPVDAPTAA